MNGLKVLRGPWPERASWELPLDGFREQVQIHFSRIITACAMVVDVQEVFGALADIRPADCSDAIDALQALRESIQDLRGLIGDRRCLPATIAPLRYQILVPLHFIEEEARHLIPLIKLFRSNCLRPSTQMIMQQQMIIDKLDIVVEASQELEQKGSIFLEQPIFHQRADAL